MKTKLLFMLVLFALNAPLSISASESKSVSSATPVGTENKMSEEEAARLTKRIEEIRAMDKSNLTAGEKRELRKEVKGIKEKVRRDGGVIYISAGTILIIILILLLL